MPFGAVMEDTLLFLQKFKKIAAHYLYVAEFIALQKCTRLKAVF